FEAIRNEHEAIALKLIAHGADPNPLHPQDKAPVLSAACKHGLHKVVNELIAMGADITREDTEGNTALWSTIKAWSADDPKHEERKAISQLLISLGAEIDARNRNGWTAAHWASSRNRTDLLGRLHSGELGAKADLAIELFSPRFPTPRSERTALHLAVRSSSVDVVKFLLGHGVDPNIPNYGGWTALHQAVDEGTEEIVKLLTSWRRGSTFVNPNLRLPNGMTPLHCAASKGHRGAINELLGIPAIDITTKDKMGRTAMMCTNDPEVANLLSPFRILGKDLPLDAPDATIFDIVFHSRESYQIEIAPVSICNLLFSANDPRPPPGSCVSVEKLQTKNAFGFKWIHLPANNMIWFQVSIIANLLCVPIFINGQALISKAWIERDCRDPGAFEATVNILEQKTRGLSYQGPFSSPIAIRQKVTAAGWLPRMMRYFDITRVPVTFIKVPFLHYETAHSYEIKTKAQQPSIHQEHSTTRETQDGSTIRVKSPSSQQHRSRRTLDQYFYSGIETARRDQNQVVTRHDISHCNSPRMLMVEQLWLCIPSDDLIITCFPSSWNPPKPYDPLSPVCQTLTALKGGTESIHTIHHLALVIVDCCMNILDSPSGNRTFQPIRIFQHAVASVASQETDLLVHFREYWDKAREWLLHRRAGERNTNIPTPHATDGVLDALLDIGKETSIIVEVKDIQDELQILSSLTDVQLTVLEKLELNVLDLARSQADRCYKDEEVSGLNIMRLEARTQKIFLQLEARRRDLQRTESRAKAVETNLRTLLELKQMQSNALEAKFARDQAISAARQGQTILVFTIVTIIFLPMSFIATVFTINFQEWGDQLTIPYVSKYMFGISLAVSIPLVVMALTVADVVRTVKSMFAFVRGAVMSVLRRDGDRTTNAESV
ncbi:hypothetical protein B0H63DRAFT_405147, partial [Podospora didyma]